MSYNKVISVFYFLLEIPCEFHLGPQKIHWRPQDFHWRPQDFRWRPQDFPWRQLRILLETPRFSYGGLQWISWGPYWKSGGLQWKDLDLKGKPGDFQRESIRVSMKVLKIFFQNLMELINNYFFCQIISIIYFKFISY